MPLLDEDRLFPIEPSARALARDLYDGVRDLPIVSPHGHTDPRWYAEDEPFPDPARLFVVPDHYVFRMLHSQGMALADLGVPRADGGPTETDGRAIWRCSPRTTTCCAAPRRASGSTTRSRPCSDSTGGSRPKPPTTATTISPIASPARSSGRGPCSSASASR